MKIAVGNSRMDKNWKNRDISWEDFRNTVRTTKRTTETVTEFRKMSRARQDSIKDVGGFVGGALREGKRRNGYVLCRSMLTLDMDYAEPSIWEQIDLLHDWRCLAYSTHKHTPEAPRLRLIIPLSREIGEDEYPALGRMVAKEIGINLFDDTTYEASRLMYWPSTPADGEFVFREKDGGLLDPDEYLARYADWRDASVWPVSSRQSEVVRRQIIKQSDPLTKEGIIGVFCRSYSIEEAIETFLSDVYEPSVMNGRYDYIPADSSAGLVIYDGKFAYSHHATDPACGRLLNAFDLVRIHHFRELDDKVSDNTPPGKLPSFKAMSELAVKDERVREQFAEERKVQAASEFSDEDWQKHLDLDKTGTVKNTLRNLTMILENDPVLEGIVFNQLSDGMEIKGEVPWPHPSRFWRDADDAQLISFVDGHYGSFSARNYEIAVTKVTDDRSYHPIREFIEALPEWDHIPRVDTLLVDYLGATDNAYVRSVTRKTLCAAIARILTPGIKFDSMLVLNGPQGVGKSTLIAKLGGEWFSDSLSLSDTKDKTAAEKLQGYWILEIGELAGLKKAELETLRSFLSRQNDIYRASFGRRATPHLRQCVFFGTTNAEKGYLRDTTGNRRFWPVKTPGSNKKQSWQLTKDEILQIWAEARIYVKAGEKLIGLGMFSVIGFISLLAHYYTLNGIKSKTVGDGQHGIARFATESEIKKTYVHVPYEPMKWRCGQNLPTVQGLVVGCKTQAGLVTALVDDGDIHCLMIGAAGVGKTANFLYPNIEYACASGMSWLCTDTKGDLFRNYAGIAKDYYGYKISVLDLRNPTRSDGDNILHLVNKYIDAYMKNPDNLSLKAKAEKYAKITAKTIITSSGEDVSGYGQNAFFYDAAEGLLTSVILLIAEYCPPEKRHIISVFKMIQDLLAPSPVKNKSQFQLLMNKLPADHKARWFAGATLNTADQAMASVLSTAMSRLNAFLDSEMEQILCFDSSLDTETFCKEKSAIFIVLPEEDTTKYFMVSLFLQQLYREMLTVADEYGGKLPNRVMIFADEIGTIPKIQSMEMMFSAGRSRRISMVPIIQSFAQLQKNYGKEGSAVIIDNCQDILFGGFAPNSESADILSKALGNKTVMSGSISRGKNDPSQSLQMIQRPLMTPDELKTLPKGHFILAKTGCCPMRTTLKLFLKWGIVFEKPYEVEERSARKVSYADRFELEQEILQRGCAYEDDFDEVSEPPDDIATGGALHTPVQEHQEMMQKPPLRTD